MIRRSGTESDTLAEGFKRRLRKIAELVGSVNALAKASGIAQSTIRKYFDRGEPPRSVIFRLAGAAGVRAEWLLTGEGTMRAAEQTTGEDVVWILDYNVHASAGAGSEVGPERVDGLVAFRRDWLRNKLRVDPARLCLIHVEGDSMEPTLRPGDTILVDRSDTLVRDGVFALGLDGALHVKRLHHADRNTVEVLSDNPSYRPRRIPAASVGEEARIIGRVVWADRKF